MPSGFMQHEKNGLVYMTAGVIGAKHAFSTRYGGVSEGDFSSLNLGFNRGDEAEKVLENYRKLGEATGIDTMHADYTNQVHGNVVRIATEEDRRPPNSQLLMNMAGITTADRKVAVEALKRSKETGGPAAALELDNGRIVTGKTTNLLGASAALLLNVLKELAGIDHDLHIISPESIEPIQKLKVDYLKSKNPRLHTDEVLIALSASAAVNPNARLALSQLPKLDGCQAHTSVMLSDVDIKIFKKLGVQLTCEAVFEHILLS